MTHRAYHTSTLMWVLTWLIGDLWGSLFANFFYREFAFFENFFFVNVENGLSDLIDLTETISRAMGL